MGVSVNPTKFVVLVRRLIPACEVLPLLFVENGIVQVEPNVQDCPLTVVAGFSNPAFGKPVALVRTRALGVPRFGVAKTALVPKTKVPVPFASLMMPRNCAEVVEAN